MILSADSVREALDTLVIRVPALKSHVMDDSGNLQPFINLFINNQQITDLDSDTINLTDDSEFLIVSALAGG